MVEVTARRRRGFTHDVVVDGEHELVLDEPEQAGGGNEGPSPTRAVAAALAGCVAITVEMYAARKGWEIGEVECSVQVEYGEASLPRSFDVTLRVPAELSAEQVERLRTIAQKCPVHRLLAGDRQATITDRVELVR